MSGWPSAIDPVLYNHTAVRRVVPQIFDTLIRLDPAGGGLHPALATGWERLDARRLRLTLRRDVLFHDGSRLSAADVAFSLSPARLLGQENRRGVAQQTLSTVDRAEPVDAHTVIVHAKDDDPLLEQRLASWSSQIISRRAFEAAGGWGEKWLTTLTGTGPYRLAELRTHYSITLLRHDGYWGGTPPFARIEYRIVPELAARVAGLLSGEYDIITDLVSDQFANIAGRPELEVVGGPVENIRLLGINTTGPVLGKVGVRRALSLAINRKMIIDHLWDGRLPVPNGFQMPGFGPTYIADFPAPAHDPAAARRLLREAGYAGERIVYGLLNDYYPNQVATAQVMVEMWREVGLNVEIEIHENIGQIYAKPDNAIFDASATANFMDHLGQGWRLFGPAGTFVRQVKLWHNEEYWQLGQVLGRSADVAERRAAHRRMLEILDRVDPPCVILHLSGHFYGKRRDVDWRPLPSLDVHFGPSGTTP